MDESKPARRRQVGEARASSQARAWAARVSISAKTRLAATSALRCRHRSSQGFEFGGAERQPGDGDAGRRSRLLDPAGLVRRVVVPDEQLRHVRAHLAEERDEGGGIVLAIALAGQAH